MGHHGGQSDGAGTPVTFGGYRGRIDYDADTFDDEDPQVLAMFGVVAEPLTPAPGTPAERGR